MTPLLLTAIACIEIPVTGDCLVLTEVSTTAGKQKISFEGELIVPKGPAAFEDDCTLSAEQPCDPFGTGYCPDWIELCNTTSEPLQTGDFQVGPPQSNPFAPDPQSLPDVTLRPRGEPGDCHVFVADEGFPDHRDSDGALIDTGLDTPDKCGILSGFDREIGGQFDIISDNKRCGVRNFRFLGQHNPRETLVPVDTTFEEWEVSDSPTPGTWEWP